MKRLWKKIKRLVKLKKHYFLTDRKTHSLEEISDILAAEVAAKKKLNQKIRTRVMKKVNRLQSRSK